MRKKFVRSRGIPESGVNDEIAEDGLVLRPLCLDDVHGLAELADSFKSLAHIAESVAVTVFFCL